MLSKRERQQVEEAAEAVVEVLRESVRATVADPGPGHARQVVGGLLTMDQRADAQDGPARLMTTYTLLGWLTAVRAELSDRPERVDTVLGWIGENVGSRYRARARYTSAALRSDDEAGEIVEYLEALGDDFLPSLVWLLAGAVACYGDGDVEWLLSLEEAAAAPDG